MKIIAALNNVQQSISALYNDNYFDVFTYAKNFILIVTKLYLSPPLSNKDIDDPSGGRNGLFVKKLCLIDCARLAESV